MANPIESVKTKISRAKRFTVKGATLTKPKRTLGDRCNKHVSEYIDLEFGGNYVRDDGKPIVSMTQQEAIIVYHPINKVTQEVDESVVRIGVDVNVVGVESILQMTLSLLREANIKISKLYSVDQEVIIQYYTSNSSTQNHIVSSTKLKMLEKVIIEAMREDASDIDINVIPEKSTSIMMKIHGIKRLKKCPFSQNIGHEVIQAMLQKSDTEIPSINLTSSSKLDPVDFSYIVNISGSKVLLRCNLKKASINNKLCLSMRLSVFNPNMKKKSLKELGYSEAVSFRLTQLVSRTSGLFLITGITGSGKTTTATSLWNDYMRSSYIKSLGFTKTLLCLDDPTESEISGANHFELGASGGVEKRISESNNYIRSFLRSSPDAISIGEIRDQTLLAATMEAARTGHVCGSTMHVSSWPSVFSRIQEDFGIKTNQILLNNLMLFIVTQKLVPKLCPDCALTVGAALKTGNTQSTKSRLVESFFGKSESDRYLYANSHSNSNCSTCKGIGVIGRHMVYECFDFAEHNNDVVDLLLDYKLAQAYKLWSNKPSNGVEGEPIGNMIYKYFKKGEIDSYLAYTLLQEHKPSDVLINSEELNYAIS
jgi:type II secretory ATPase GspE/PulE/Tfp pilus assembly ATPase PilB-like protein